MNTIAIKELSQNKKNMRKTIFTNIMFSRLYMTFILSFLSLFFFIGKDYSSEFLIYNFVFTFFQILLIDWFLIAIDLKKLLLYSLLSGVIVQYLSFTYFYNIDYINIESIRISQVLYILLSTAIMLFFTKRFFNFKLIKKDKIIEYLKMSMPLLSAYSLKQTYYTGIPIVISNTLGFYEAGIYGAASRIALIFINLRSIVVQPLSKDFYKFDIKMYNKFYKKYLYFVLPLSFIYYVITYYFSYEIIALVYGNEYLNELVISVFRISMLLPIIYIVFIGDEIILTSFKKQKYIMYASICASILFFMSIFIINTLIGYTVVLLICGLTFFLVIRIYIHNKLIN